MNLNLLNSRGCTYCTFSEAAGLATYFNSWTERKVKKKKKKKKTEEKYLLQTNVQDKC